MTSLCVYPCVYCIYYFYIFITDCSSNTAILENKTQFTDIHTCGNKQEDKVHCNEHFFLINIYLKMLEYYKIYNI